MCVCVYVCVSVFSIWFGKGKKMKKAQKGEAACESEGGRKGEIGEANTRGCEREIVGRERMAGGWEADGRMNR